MTNASLLRAWRLSLLAPLLISCAGAGAAQTTPRRVILLIADGAGVEHWTLAKFARQQTTRDHTAAFVPLFASGPGAERFGGLKENWEIGRLLLEAVAR